KLPMFVREQKLVLESEDHQCPKGGSEMRDGKPQKTLKDEKMNVAEQMGGIGEVVQTDESLFRGKQNGYEVRFFHVQRRDRATLVPIILKHVAPGTTVWSDEWGAYKNLKTQYGYDNQTVNHSQNFVDPHTGCHTQLIECLSKTKILRAMRGLTLLDSHLNELWYRSVHKDMFSLILADIRRFRM
ncbi:unnamed protein product, partial [Didymodactylos carnosus]